jgi:hypothetical protein
MAAQTNRIPLVVKLAYTAFMAVLVPFYWASYGPTNFLYFCDVALFLTLAAVWTERPILASMPLLGILVPQALWVLDFLAGCVGVKFVGMTAYMFDPKIALFARGLSFFHFWLPFFLIYLVWRLGYDRRTWLYWSALAWVLLAVCYLFLPAPPAPPDKTWMPVNVNYVYGLSDDAPQQWMPQGAWLACLFLGLPLLVYLPTHIVLRKFMPRAGGSQGGIPTAPDREPKA